MPTSDITSSRPSDLNRRFAILFASGTQPQWHGGSATVRKVVNSRGETFALKSLRVPSVADGLTPETISKLQEAHALLFKEEYRTQTLLSHLKGFPRLYGHGVLDGSPVIVMEWVDGVTLSSVAGSLPRDVSGNPSANIIAKLGIAILGILQKTELLDVKLVHRDLSPNNIMLRKSNIAIESQLLTGDFDICLIDFGSAFLKDRENPELTRTYDIWREGTPEYAPPEMLTHDLPNMEQMRVSDSIDVYEVCSILYELYSQHTPYRIGERLDASPYRIKMEEPLERPPLHETRDVKLVEAILSGLAIDQADRCSAGRLLAELTAFIGDKPVSGSNQQEAADRYAALPPISPAIHSDTGSAGTVGTGSAGAAGATSPTGSGTHNTSKRRKVIITVAVCVAVVAFAAITWWTLRQTVRDVFSPAATTETATGSGTDDAAGASTGAGADTSTGTAASVKTVAYDGSVLYKVKDVDTGLWGFVNSSREWVIAPTYLNEPSNFDDEYSRCIDNDTGLMGFINVFGAWAIDPIYTDAGVFGSGLAPVQDAQSKKWGYIDASGAWSIEPSYDEAKCFENGYAAVLVTESTRPKWSYIDTSGTIVIDSQFYGVGSFSEEGLAPAATGAHQWGFIDTSGAWAIEVQFIDVSYFQEGYAPCMPDALSEQWGFIDTSGNIAIDAVYRSVRHFHNGIAAVQDKATQLWGAIDTSGNWVIQPRFEQLGDFYNGLAPAQDDDTDLYGYVDQGGNWVIPAQYADVGISQYGY